MVKCPICPHECQSYETLFTHLMQFHQKNDLVAAFLKHLEAEEKRLAFIAACEEEEA